MKSVAVLCLFTLSALAAEHAPGKRPFTATDYYSLETPGDPQISPDGKLIAYTVTSIDRKQNKKRTEIWMAAVDGSAAPWPFAAAGNSSAPRWRPDGRALAFISARADPQSAAPPRPQVYLMLMSGGDPRKLTDLKNGVTGFQWAPDGASVACVGKIGRSDNAVASKERSDVRDYVNPAYKLDGAGFWDDRRSHVWVVDFKTGAARQITSGDEQNDMDPQWSPDGKSIAYVGQRTDGDLMADMNLSVVPAEGGTPRELSNIEVGVHAPRWSPDGKRIAFVGSVDSVAIPKMWIAPAAGGQATVVSNDVTYATELEWSEDGRSLFYAGAFKGEHPVFRIDLASRKVEPLTSRWGVRQIDVHAATNTLAFIAADDTHPGDLYITDLQGGNRRQLTKLNAKLLSEVET